MNEESLNFKVEGGFTLQGEVEIKKSKNAAVGLLCASILNEGTTTLKKVPKIEEVFRIIEVLQSIGIKITWQESDLLIQPGKIDLSKMNISAAEKTRTVIMMIGPLIHLFKSFSLPHAGGCKLGSRIVTPHFYAMENLGISIETESSHYNIYSQNLYKVFFLFARILHSILKLSVKNIFIR
jgi:UDP-N-acetylglucosamine 1-carboxyvinyltransferase